MSAEKPTPGRSLVTAAQCLQNFVSEMERVESDGPAAVDVAALEENGSTKVFQQAPVTERENRDA